MASDVKLALSMRIARHGDIAEVAFAAKVSVVSEYQSAVDECLSTVGCACTGDRTGAYLWASYVTGFEPKVTCSPHGDM